VLTGPAPLLVGMESRRAVIHGGSTCSFGRARQTRRDAERGPCLPVGGPLRRRSLANSATPRPFESRASGRPDSQLDWPAARPTARGY
jgi:hypothetical protein